jgi:hypothetical protein
VSLNDKDEVSAIFLIELSSSEVLHLLISLHYITDFIFHLAHDNFIPTDDQNPFLVVLNDDYVRKLPTLILEEICLNLLDLVIVL